MKQAFRILVLAVAMIPQLVQANEGMWLVSLLNRMNEAEMKGLGLNLTAEEIYSINNASLKDAIVRLNYGQCTGEVVSDKGLIFTNHHCAYDAIQTLSTVQNNYLVNGYCAKSFKEDLPIPDFKISFLIRIDDVTKDVLAVVNNSMSEADREKAIAAKIRELSAANNGGGKYEIEVKSFFHGNEFYMMVYQTYRDIRLVGNPPESVGKFGGDTDNWMWPRHTGDFSMLRIYANANNEPADYSADNVPYKPKHSLPVNIEGLNKGDFTMIMGFPGRTNRYLTSFGIEQAVAIRNPILIECLGTKLEAWKREMDKDEAIDLMYAAKYASTANGWKYYIGQTKGLKRLDVKGKKAQIEKDFTRWYNADETRKSKYANTLNLIEEYHKAWDPQVKAATYSSLAGVGGAEFLYFAVELSGAIKQAMAETDMSKRNEILASLKEEAANHFKEYNATVDKGVFVDLSNLHRKRIAAEELPSWHADVTKKYKGNMQTYADKLFATSIFTDLGRLNKFLDKPNVKLLDKDLGAITANSAYEHAMAFNAKNPREKMTKGYREFTAGLREMNPNKAYAPDANSTMRITYGVVDGYKGADAVHYDHYTTANGIMEKRDNTNPEFVVPDKLADLIQKKDFGRYANDKGELVTCFIHNLDITGGNSGSPVMDSDGNLVGIAFDGNWEAMSGDIAFESELQRTISVDIRYVLFTIEKLMGGQNIIDELKFATRKKRTAEDVPAAVPSGLRSNQLGNTAPSKDEVLKRAKEEATILREEARKKAEEGARPKPAAPKK